VSSKPTFDNIRLDDFELGTFEDQQQANVLELEHGKLPITRKASTL
jgi:hypothetical protein